MRTILYIAAAAFAASSFPAFAQMDLRKIQTANGLAEAVKNAEYCGYKIDQSKLENYYVEADLDDPDTLSFISSTVEIAMYRGKPDASTCTMSKMTARKIGILEE